MKKKVIFSIVALLIMMQFFKIDKTNPSSLQEHDFLVMMNAPDNIRQSFKNACYDCHSNQTVYPWYTDVAPISFWIKGHIKNARSNVNFSEWQNQYDDKGRSHKIQESIEKIEAGHMPPKSYKWMHQSAKLSDAQNKELLNWLRSI